MPLRRCRQQATAWLVMFYMLRVIGLDHSGCVAVFLVLLALSAASSHHPLVPAVGGRLHHPLVPAVGGHAKGSAEPSALPLGCDQDASAGSGVRLYRATVSRLVSLDTSWSVHGPLLMSKSLPNPSHLPVSRWPVGSASIWIAPKYTPPP